MLITHFKKLMKALGIVGVCSMAALANSASNGRNGGIDAFNQALSDATRRMDNAATVALWDDNGISLLPSTPPIVGKKAIAKFLADVTAKYPNGHMQRFEMQCFDIEVAGDWATEWCQEHQIVVFSDGAPTFEGWGKMLMVLHGDGKGKWLLKREMWNQAPEQK